MGGALGDLLVIDLTSVRSGPTCTKILADFGAEALRIETHGPVKVLGLPVALSRPPPSVRTPPPVPGAHVREVLERLGCAADEFVALAAAGALEVAK